MTKTFLAALLGFAMLFTARSALCADHPAYEIKAAVDTTAKTITAQQTVSLTNNTGAALKEVIFHIYPNRKYSRAEQAFMLRFGGYFKVDPFPSGFPDDVMRIGSVTVDGQTADFTIEGEDETILNVKLPKRLSPGDGVELTLSFSVDLPHAYSRLGWMETIIKASRWYPILAVHQNGAWNTAPFYPFHRPFFSDAATYNVELTIPQDEVLIHSGIRKSEALNDDSTKTVLVETPLPVREFTFAMSRDYAVIEDEAQGVSIRSFYLPGDEVRARLALQSVKDMMRYYTQRLGPYPYEQYSIAPVHLGYGGEQMANMCFIDTRAYKLPRFLDKYFDFLVAHETGHQWIFNVLGVDEYRQMWLEEGVNSYFTTDHLVRKYGADADIMTYPPWLKNYDWLVPKLTFWRSRDYRYKNLVRRGSDQAVVKNLSSFFEPSTIFALAYGKGARIVEMIKNKLGAPAFDRAWQGIFQEYRFKNISVETLKEFCEKESGQDLSSLFEQWLFQPGHLDQVVSAVHEGTVVLKNKGEIVMPSRVSVVYSDGTSQVMDWDGRSLTIKADPERTVRSVTIDPQEEWLDIDRVNNHWPRKVTVRPVPLYLGLYEIPVFLPEDSYNVVVGPELANSGVGVKASLQKPYDQIAYAATDYEFGEKLHHSRVGYQLKNVGKRPAQLGFEIANVHDLDDGADDLVSGKVYYRRELWPAQYGLSDINDHISLYLIRNQSVNDGVDFISGREDSRNLDYGRRKEAIVGTKLRLNRSGPYPDPKQGWVLDLSLESAGHFLEATQYFNRGAADLSVYQSLTRDIVLATRVKYGWGYPNDKNLYNLGGADGLRGYERKTLRGSHLALGSLEIRFPILKKLRLAAIDNVLSLEEINGVAFFDLGQSWYGDIDESKLKKDAGLGLRFKVNIGSLLEQVLVRLDVAQAIKQPKQDTQFWFGINHAF